MTVYLRDATTDRYVTMSGKGLGPRLRAWRVPALWSATHRGFHVRAEHLPDLSALFDAHGIRVVDQRSRAWS